MFRSALSILIFAIAPITSSHAASYNISGSFSGGALGDVFFDVDIAADFTGDIQDTSSGLTTNTLTSSRLSGGAITVAGGLGYSYSAATDSLRLGGLSGRVEGLGGWSTDFTLVINDFTTAPMLGMIRDIYYDPTPFSWPELPEGTICICAVIFTPPQIQEPTAGEVNVVTTENGAAPAVVPLPAGLPLLLTGFAGFAGLRIRKRRLA